MAGQCGNSSRWKRFLWPVIGLTAISISFWLLTKELRGMSWHVLWLDLRAIPSQHWLMILICTLGCYLILAAYDGLALQHLHKKVGYLFIALCSLSSYALSHTLGASAFTGAVIRYRAYSTKGLSAAEVGVLATFCSLTFALGVMMLLGALYLLVPALDDRFSTLLSGPTVRWIAFGLLALVIFYLIGSALKLPDLIIRNFRISYPSLSIALKQVVVAPVELFFAGGILYFALPALGNPGYFVVLGVFVVGFTLALLSHAPGGIGVFELAVITALPEFPPETVLAALLVFRLCYFLIPLAIGLLTVAYFEHQQLKTVDAQPNDPPTP
ncbi:lysylphosphatidylglycerol synthase domain-containing protein [Paracoccus aminophilus]|uniref:Uncharacterized protein n=1 Tax=Paracoccus aminophilus JCM 7686 TaxID=1367847 RepID=S5Z147_PARAH|nr:lysylphosphatidylglycerol synthase domain-containing protein [Paracoccus aminophilus]AGT11151.1 hypothetical protein JCM7686_pAMI5p085 [Paracoccus aminophilus JCM 7686]